MSEQRPDRTPPADLSNLKRISVHDRPAKVAADRVAMLPALDATISDYLDCLPGYLGVDQLRRLANAIALAHAARLPVIFFIGGHVVKVGCSPILIDLIRRGIITHLAMNGSVAIHDYEMAATGTTSEDVGTALREGLWGMARETAEALAIGARAGADSGRGFGAAMGRHIAHSDLPHGDLSLLAAAWQFGRGTTIHVGIGCDTVHMHPEADGAAIGQASHIDFRILVTAVRDMDCDDPHVGGVFVNCGSAVFGPEVFIKAYNVVRNQGCNLESITTANLDMIQHYRPGVNVVGRPAAPGRGLTITGQHELTLPLLRMAILKAMR
ncbi:MAG: hypothetical protein ACOC95_02965 [Planctomycetota bacterium]